MEEWTKISLLLSMFGFLKEFRPSEPFYYEYLVEYKNLTDDQVTNEVYPASAYVGIIAQVILFLVTDILRYKPLIFLLGLSGVVIYALIIWGTTLLEMIIVQSIYGIFIAAEVAYFSYIYAKVDKKYYPKVAAHSRGAILIGRTLAGVVSQFGVSFNLLDLQELNYMCFGSCIAGTIWSLLLPPVSSSIYFHSSHTKSQSLTNRTTAAFLTMKLHFTTAYANPSVLSWSTWYAFSTGGYILIDAYMQPLYAVVQTFDQSSYNGAVMAVLMFLGFLAALFAGYLHVDWDRIGEVVLGTVSLAQGGLLVVASQTSTIWVCYGAYLLFAILFHFTATVASAQIAKWIEEDSYGLVFGVNTFVALSASAIVVAVFVSKGVGFAFGPRDQFVSFGAYHMAISLVFFVLAMKRCFGSRKWRKNVETTKGSSL